MALKFRKSVTLFPGFRLNLSKSGMSATVGMRGMSVNVGHSGSYLNVGLPGTGLYDRIKLGAKEHPHQSRNSNDFSNTPISPTIEKKEIEYKSFNPELVTSEGLFGLKESIIKAQAQKEELLKESVTAKNSYYLGKTLYVISCILIFGFFVKWFKRNSDEKKTVFDEAQEMYESFSLEIEFNLDKEVLNEYIDVKNYFHEILKCLSIWDVKTAKENDKVKERTIASTSIDRARISFEMAKLDFINSKFEAIRMNNVNSGDLYIYPGFVLLLNKMSGEFGLVDFREVELSSVRCSFVESESVPADSKVVGQTWKYTNKNGSPDKRFNNNYQIPIVLYNEFFLKSQNGLNECYLISNYETGSKFCEVFDRYIQTLKKMNWTSEN